MSDRTVKTYTIYKNPLDFPDKYVMRVFENTPMGSFPTSEIAVSTNLENVRSAIPNECVCIMRSPGDDPAILETWI